MQFTTPGRKRGMVLLDLAATALQRRDIEQACSHITDVIEIVVVGSSSFLRNGVLKLRSQLEPYAGSVSVHGIDQQMRLLA